MGSMLIEIVVAHVCFDTITLAKPGQEPGTYGKIVAKVCSGRAAYQWARDNGCTIRPGTLLPEGRL